MEMEGVKIDWKGWEGVLDEGGGENTKRNKNKRRREPLKSKLRESRTFYHLFRDWDKQEGKY